MVRAPLAPSPAEISMVLTVIGPSASGRYLAAAAARTGADVRYIGWDSGNAAELETLHEYAIDVFPVATGSDPKFRLERRHLTESAAAAIMNSDLAVVCQSGLAQLHPECIGWLANELGIRLAVHLAPDDPVAAVGPFDTVFWSSPDIADRRQAGESDLSICRAVAESGPVLVGIIHPSGAAFLFARDVNEGYDVAARPGAGRFADGLVETFIGAYLAEQLRTDNFYRAGQFAALAAARKQSYAGPLRETAEELDHVLQSRSPT